MASSLASAASVVSDPIASVVNAVLPSDTGFLGPIRGGAALVSGIFLGQAVDTLAYKLGSEWKAPVPSATGDSARNLFKSTLISVSEAMVAILVLEVASSKMNALHTTVLAIALIPQLNYAELTAKALWGKVDARL